MGSEAPLWEGIGTHYVHIYVGTPPQRVSVIVDTGSHHTAFPCDGCKNCGKHTDPYFNPKKSSTSQTVGCSQCKAAAHCVSRRCEFSQSYTEGSSWKAIQIIDKLWPGGQVAESEPAAMQNQKLAVDFMFGCQFSETGLFRTQKADGIMGLSANALTLVPQMRTQHKSNNQAFSLCFMKGGGIMTIGGADPVMQDEPMVLVPLSKTTGWFTVHLEYVSVGGKKLDVQDGVYNSGKGVIVDSGTTDTYLPRKMAGQFKKAWKDIVGKDYGNTKMTFSDEDFAKLPIVSFTFKDVEGNKRTIDVRPDAYMERANASRSAKSYVPRIYVNEGQGAVLGANFMQDYNVLFDQDNKRVGFARSRCNYESHIHHGASQQAAASTTPAKSEDAVAQSPAAAAAPAAPAASAPSPADATAAAAETVTPVGDTVPAKETTATDAKEGTPVPALVEGENGNKSRLQGSDSAAVSSVLLSGGESTAGHNIAADGLGTLDDNDKASGSTDLGPKALLVVVSVLVCSVVGRQWFGRGAPEK